MPAFTSDKGRAYEVDGRYVVWTPETWEDEPALPTVRLPLRIKLGPLLKITEQGAVFDNTMMRATLLAIAPAIAPVIEDMDVNDFQDMFQTWLATYNQFTGASLGEASPSADS